MWWDKDGLTSGGAECAPVRVFLAPSFCVFMCRLLSRQGLWNSGVLRVIWRSAAGVLLLAIVSCLGVIPQKERMSPMHMVAGKLGLWRKRGISSPGVDCEGARAACPARRWGVGALCWVTLGSPSCFLFFAVTCFVCAVTRNFACLACVGCGHKPLLVLLLRLHSCPRDP